MPSGVEIITVVGTQLVPAIWHSFCSKTSCALFGLGTLRLLADDTNATYVPPWETAGCPLGALPGVTPSGDETRYVVGTHVDVVVLGCVIGVMPPHKERT